MPFRTNLKLLALTVALFLLPFISSATHILGMDLYYAHVSGNTYKIYLVAYGDCSGGAFSSLSASTPAIKIYNGGTLFSTISLSLQAPTAGLEVSPVCPSMAALLRVPARRTPFRALKNLYMPALSHYPAHQPFGGLCFRVAWAVHTLQGAYLCSPMW